MSEIITLEQVKHLVTKLPQQDQLKLAALICDELSAQPAEELREERLKLAEELLKECDDIDDDSEGLFNSVEDIRQIREERMRKI